MLVFSACNNESDLTSGNEQSTDSEISTDSEQTSNNDAVCRHIYGNWSTVKQATCKEEGELVRTCTKCYKQDKSIVAKTNKHKEFIIKKGYGATCTTDGLTDSNGCSVCNIVLSEQTVISAFGHTEVVDNPIQATCTSSGLTQGKHCFVCKEILEEQLTTEALGHIEVVDESVGATCTSTGLTEGKHCSRCSEIFVAQNVVSKLEHNFVNNVCSHCDMEKFTDSLVFTISDDGQTYTVSGISDESETNIRIPNRYKGKPVVAVGYEAFNESNIASVEFGSNIECIDAWAFRACNQLTSIVLPNNVSNINEGAFAGCSNLTTVVMQNNVLELGKMAFYQCSKLSSISLSDKLTTIGIGAFADNVNLETIVLPNSLIKIGEQAFVGCINLSSIDIPDKVEYIDEYAFAQCYSLEKINIGASSLKIGPRSFMECESLTELIIPGNVEYIDIQAFAYCTSLTKVKISTGIKSINSAAFQGCNKIEEMELPFIGHTQTSEQFLGWIFGITSWYKDNGNLVPETLNTITISGNSIAENAFNGCCNIKNIILTNNLKEIEKDAFIGCSSITYVNFIGTSSEWASISFENYYSNPIIFSKTLNINNELLTNAHLTGISIVETYAFVNCHSLKSIVFDSQIESIESNAFSQCLNLCSVSFPDSLTDIGTYAFEGCERLLKLTLPVNLNKIDTCAFLNCESLYEICNNSSLRLTKGNTNNGYVSYYALNIYTPLTGESLISEDENGFVFYENTSNMALVSYKGNSINIELPETYKEQSYTIQKYAFKNCLIESVIIPDTVLAIEEYAFENCSSLKIVSVGKGVERIGVGAFKGCSAIEELTLPFVGETRSSTGLNCLFGYIFGYSTQYSSEAICQYYDKSNYSVSAPDYYYFYIPLNLKKLYLTDAVVIPRFAFNRCGGFEIDFPKTLQLVRENAFEASRFTKFTFKSGLHTIYEDAFRDSTELKSVYFPKTLSKIESGAFVNCYNLESVTFASTSGWKVYRTETSEGKAVIVTSPSNNALYLTDTWSYYCSYIWKNY